MKQLTTSATVACGLSLACLLATALSHPALGTPAVRAQEAAVPDTAKLEQMIARFAPTDIGADLSQVSDADRRVLGKLVDASKIIDALFLRQVWAGNDAMLLDLVRDQSPAARARAPYFFINKGPWAPLRPHHSLVPGAPP